MRRTLAQVEQLDVWSRVSTHYTAAASFGRRAVEEAWRCGDALIAAKAETPHGEWLPALRAAGISHDVAKRLMRLRQTYANIGQIALFDTVSQALKLPQAIKPPDAAATLTIRNPEPVLLAAKELELERLRELMSLDVTGAFAWWIHPEGGNGLTLWTAATSAVYAWAEAFVGIESDSTEEDCQAVNDLHEAVLILATSFYARARRSCEGSADRQVA